MIRSISLAAKPLRKSASIAFSRLVGMWCSTKPINLVVGMSDLQHPLAYRCILAVSLSVLPTYSYPLYTYKFKQSIVGFCFQNSFSVICSFLRWVSTLGKMSFQHLRYSTFFSLPPQLVFEIACRSLDEDLIRT